MQNVSGWVNDRKNIFMVGDVKQSIYRFRLARPELFMEKYKKLFSDRQPGAEDRSSQKFPKQTGSSGKCQLYFPTDHGSGSGWN